MIIKKREQSIDYFILESLNARMELSFQDKRFYENQLKGYQGEVIFDRYVEEFLPTGIVISDLLVNTGQTHYQIDSLVIYDQHLLLFEIKNHQGAFTFTDQALQADNGYTIQNPLDQVDRKRTLLHNSLHKLGYKLPITRFVVFINPDFYIYSLPKNNDIIFSGQLERVLKNIAGQNQPASKRNLQLAHKLVGLHDANYRPSNLPSYAIEDLRKGIYCEKCFSFEHTGTRQTRICKSCGHRENASDAIYRSIKEFHLLFPEKLITTKHIYEWCGQIYSMYQIRTLLQNKLQFHKAGNHSEYTF